MSQISEIARQLDFTWVGVPPAARSSGRTLGELRLRATTGVSVVGIIRDGVLIGQPRRRVHARARRSRWRCSAPASRSRASNRRHGQVSILSPLRTRHRLFGDVHSPRPGYSSPTRPGNVTITGSVANIIVVERAAAEQVPVGFQEYARVGVPVTLVTLALGSAWLWLIG